jgi:hypothetical protein
MLTEEHMDKVNYGDCSCGDCDGGAELSARLAAGWRGFGACSGGGRCSHCAKLIAMLQSGQPCIDPWMQADWIAQQRAAVRSWHAGYYHTQYGAPLALMVAPTARMQTRWGWGVAQSTISPIYHQFKRPYPGPVYGGAGMVNPLRPTPRWPSHTDQFGVYYVRGPW